MAVLFLYDLSFQIEYLLKDRKKKIEVFAMLRSSMFERDMNFEITVKMLLEKYHNEINEKVYFCSELKR